MSTPKPIQQFSIGYNVLRAYTTFYLRMFYRNTTIKGLENIPNNKPVILAINHQNALMDALLPLSALKKQPVFMARADIFQSPLAAKVLRWLKILPVFRIRDGVKSLQNNEAIFEEAVGVLLDGKILGILPEGSHGDQKRLRVLKKGIARIAFRAEEQSDFKLDIQIVPVGIDYTHYINFGGNVLMNFGKPFNLSAYKDEYLENEQKGMNSFMQDLRAKMIPQILHINDGENYKGIKGLIDLYTYHLEKNKLLKADHLDKVKFQQGVSDKILELKETQEDTFKDYTEKANNVNKAIAKLNLRQWVLTREKYSFVGIVIERLLQLLLFPVYLYGFITNIIQFQIPVLLSKGIKDQQFLSSIRFGLGLFTFAIMYLIYLVLIFVFVPSWIIALAVSVSIPIAGILSFKYYRWFKKTSAKFRNNRLKAKENTDWIEMRNNYSAVIAFMNDKIPKS